MASPAPATVLVVDDEEPVPSLLRRLLEQDGYSVVIAGSGSEAIRTAGAHVDSLRLLLTDVLMPDMSGVELADRMRRQLPVLTVIFLSGYPGEAEIEEALQAKGTAFLQKPFSKLALLSTVRAAIGPP